MIRKIEMYRAVCDHCGTSFIDEDVNKTAWDTQEQAFGVAFDAGWKQIDGKLYCPDCVELNKQEQDKKIMRQVLSIEQMLRLRELGVDTGDASMEWVRDTYIPGLPYELLLKDQRTGTTYEKIPAYTLQDILDKLPKQIDEYTLQIRHAHGYWVCEYIKPYYNLGIVEIKHDELIDSVYEMLMWCINNGHVNPGKEATNDK